ncbi:hypothetical protein M1271_01260 [Patescibacteria group bacterium]|nr:hypothetical protein [Patescibacteria group bacterium]MCL5797686.1 hypothetical protein [Patescibacteria group bacterium]
MQENPTPHLILTGLIILIAINLFILDLKIFSGGSGLQFSDIAAVATPSPSRLIPLPASPFTNNLCPASCISLITQATSGGTLNIGSPSESGITLQTNSSTPHETYIPLGSGTTSKSDWDDLTATETVIDTTNFGNIKEAYFTASLSNPTQNGQVEAQLFDVTDKHPVWGSDVVMNGPSSQTVTSGKITLDPGNKLYRVQLKSSLSVPVSLVNGKIRIISD